MVTEPAAGYAEEGMRVFQETQADFLIGIGGGSPLDTAKAISALAGNPGKKMIDFEGVGKIPKPGAPLIAVPTTAGTGSEVSQGMVIADTVRDRIEGILTKIAFADVNTPQEFVARSITAEDIKSEMLQAGGPPDAYDYSLKIRFSVLTTRNGEIP